MLCLCGFELYSRWVPLFHSISSRAKMKYKTLFTLFFSFPAVENNICNGKSGYPFGDFTLLHVFVEIS